MDTMTGLLNSYFRQNQNEQKARAKPSCRKQPQGTRQGQDKGQDKGKGTATKKRKEIGESTKDTCKSEKYKSASKQLKLNFPCMKSRLLPNLKEEEELHRNFECLSSQRENWPVQAE